MESYIKNACDITYKSELTLDNSIEELTIENCQGSIPTDP